MNRNSTARAHLVERALEALGGPSGLEALAPRRPFVREERGAPEPLVPPREEIRPAATPIIPMAALLRAGLAVAPGSAGRSRLAEEMAVIRQQVLRAVETAVPAEGRCARMVLVTSARPGEGKSFTALNLAASIAEGGGRPVVLVDADGKTGSVSELLGQGHAPGLRDAAADPGRHPASLVIPTEFERLAVLPCGTPPLAGGDAPPGTAVTAALLRLGATLPDHILLLDAPPCLSTSDPSVLAPISGQVLMVVQAEQTQRTEVEAALDMVEACPTLQLLLNQVRLTVSDGFGAYGPYKGRDADAGD